MNSNIFLDKLHKPVESDLSETLGKSYIHWLSIKDFLLSENILFTEEWKFYGKNLGWSLKLLFKKRNIFFFTVQKNSFSISFVFGDKAVQEVEKSSLPEDIITELKTARKYMEGRGIKIIIKNASDVKNVQKLIKIKIGANII